MSKYFSTFIPGTGEIIKKHLQNVNIELLLDGLIVYESSQPISTIKNIRFLNNSFVLVNLSKEIGDGWLDSTASSLSSSLGVLNGMKGAIPSGAKSFRIVISKENQLAPINVKILESLEKSVSKVLKLHVNRALPDIEIWFLSRREGCGLVGIRITKNHNHERILSKGELRPELANILCLLSEPSKDDIFLDSFSGSGSIVLERLRFPYKQIIASEKDKTVFKKLELKVKEKGIKITLGRWDSVNLSSLSSNSVNKIVTDPPWGIYSKEYENFGEFYSKMLKEFDRVVKPGGLMVILIGQKELFENIFSKFEQQFKLIERYDILVSGKKACICKITKL